MKRIIYPVLTGFLLVTACSKGFLDTEIPVKKTIDTFYKTPQDFDGALIDCYNVLQREGVTRPRWVFGNVISDDALKGGETIADYTDMEQLLEFQPRSANGIVGELWTNSFAGLTKANVIIDKIDNGSQFSTDEAGVKLKARYRAEAQFLRAFHYFYLARVFGDLPLLTTGITDYKDIDSKLLQRKPVAEVWALLEKDLKEAIPNLPTPADLKTNNQQGRATKGAAQALLAHAYMFQRKYDAAVLVLKDLIDNGGYSLLSDYGAVFRPEGEFSNENIFEVNFIKQDGGWAESCEGSIRNVYQMSRDDWGWGFDLPTQDLVNEFEPGDPRIIYTINWADDSYQAGQTQKNSQNNVYRYHSRKVFLLPSERPASASCAGQNEIIFRLADMYLLYAEALVQSSSKDGNTALLYLNKVRQRAASTPKVDPERVAQAYTVSNVALAPRVYTTDQQLLIDIWHERRVELALEGHRWFDLVRQQRTNLLDSYYQKWSVAGGFEAKGDLKGKFYKQWIGLLGKEDYPVFPIPQTDINQSQGNLTQTPGY